MKAVERLRRRLVARHPGPRKFLVRVPVFRLTDSVERARKSIERERDWESVNYIYIVDRFRRLHGVASIKELLNASGSSNLRSIATTDVVSVHSNTSVERAAILAIHHGIKAVPVVGRNGRFVGVIGTDEILETLQHAGIDDAIRYSGIHLEHRRLLDVLHGRVEMLVKRRLPWLVVGLGGGMLAALFVGQFEAHLRRVVELSFFTPAIVYMGAAVGSQAQALFLRAITISEVRIAKFLLKEFFVDVLIGMILGVLSYGVASLVLAHDVVPWIFGVALFITVSLSGLVSIGMTVLLSLRKNDPALGSGPFATIIQDLVSLVVYFTVASLMLPNA